MNNMLDAWPHADGPVVTTKTEYLEERGKRKPKRAVISMEEAIRTAEIGKVMYVQTGRGVVRMCIERALAPGEVHDYVCELFGVKRFPGERIF